MHASSVSVEERRWRRVITAEEERHRVIISANCHVSAEGKHRGDIQCMSELAARSIRNCILKMYLNAKYD